jgi:hypothetical protein
MTHGGSGKIITDVERTVINDLSGGVSTYDLPTASGDVLGGISTQVNNILKITGDVLDLSGGINPPVATNSTLGGAKMSTNIDISNNEFIDTIVPKFYADFSGNTNTSSPYIFSTNSTALTHTGHTLTFYKPPNTLISAKWSGVYNVTGSNYDEYMLNFRIKINKDLGGVLDNSGISMAAGYQAWGLTGTSGNGTRSGSLNSSSITLPNQLTDTSDNILASGNTDISVWLQGYGSAVRDQGAGTGGIITNYTTGGVKYIVHTFIATSNFEITSNITCDFLIVGGGGGGGSIGAGGGGAGGMAVGTNQTITAGIYSVVIGAGGIGGHGGQTGGQGAYASTFTLNGNSSQIGPPGTNGNDSSFATYIGKGGGGGSGCGALNRNLNGLNGGSGGGGHRWGNGGSDTQSTYSSTTGVAGYANDGGHGPQNSSLQWTGASGGGGGAGGAGVKANSNKNNHGGLAKSNNFRTGSDIYYSGGGAGGVAYYGNSNSKGGGNVTGQKGGGGDTKNQTYPSSYRDGTANTGGGGGGATCSYWGPGGHLYPHPNIPTTPTVGGTTSTSGPGPTAASGGTGGSGIVVIRYTESQVLSVPPETLNLSSSMLSAWVYPA